jgi:UbiD family decarboxylase
MFMACLSLPEEIDELQVAQALGGSSLGFFAHTLPVPVSTEYILIGRVLPEYQHEGPFGDSKGLYSERLNPLCMIQEMWQRRNPVFHLIRSGTSCEHIELLTMKAKHCMEKLKRQEIFLLDYQIPLYAGGRLCLLTVDEGCVVTESILEFLFNIPLIRCYILLNKDVDTNSATDILWALTHRASEPNDFKFQGENQCVRTGVKTVIDATTDDLDNWNNRRIQVFKVN